MRIILVVTLLGLICAPTDAQTVISPFDGFHLPEHKHLVGDTTILTYVIDKDLHTFRLAKGTYRVSAWPPDKMDQIRLDIQGPGGGDINLNKQEGFWEFRTAGGYHNFKTSRPAEAQSIEIMLSVVFDPWFLYKLPDFALKAPDGSAITAQTHAGQFSILVLALGITEEALAALCMLAANHPSVPITLAVQLGTSYLNKERFKKPCVQQKIDLATCDIHTSTRFQYKDRVTKPTYVIVDPYGDIRYWHFDHINTYKVLSAALAELAH